MSKRHECGHEALAEHVKTTKLLPCATCSAEREITWFDAVGEPVTAKRIKLRGGWTWGVEVTLGEAS